MNPYKRIPRLLAALLSVVTVLGWMSTAETARAATTTVKVTQIAAAQNNSIALKSDGTVIAWGDQVAGWAKPPEGLTDVVEIYAKDTTFLARKSNGTVVAWGSNNLGETNIPNGLNNVISMAAAGSHTLMVSKSSVISGTGTVIGWGLNGDGQSAVPTDAQAAVTKVAAGTYYSMALKFNGTVVDWGSNGGGATSKPANLSNVVAIDAGYMYALALKSDGTVAAWGQEYNGNGILGVSGLTGITAISANSTHALALKNDGTVVGWGNNTNGKATPPAGLTDVVAIAAGVNHSLALKRDGTVVSWGSQTSVPGNNELSSLTITEGAPSPAFSPSGTSYQYDIAPGATSVHINAVLKDSAYSALYINDQPQTSGSTVAVSVPATGAVIKVRVEPYMKAPKTYMLTVSRDRVPPSVTFSPNGSGSTTPLRTITTVVQVTDATSGIDGSTLEYAWTQTASAPASGWASFSLLPYTQLAQFTYVGADGSWYLHIRAKDYAGNGVNVTSEPFLIDNTAPVLSVTMQKETEGGDDYLEDTWSNKDVVITAAAIDALSATVTVKYTLDGGKTWTNYSGPITISDPGIHTVILQASDAIGNVQTVSRTVKISKSDLKLTITKVKVTGGGDYSSGEWTNSSVRVTATAETKAGETIASFTWSLNGEDQGNYTAGTLIFFFTDGMNSGEFKVTDSLGNSLIAPYTVNIDRTAPTVSFSPNGNESSAREASVTATVADSGGSGLVDSTLEYVWTQSKTTRPTEGWQRLSNSRTLTKAGVDGDWYLHVQGKDTAGNGVYAVSNRFVLDNSALNSTISPNTGSFDKKVSAQADVDTTLMLNGNTLEGISNETHELISGTDYVITGNTVIIQMSYLATQPEGTASLTFAFSGGAAQTLTITIDDTTPSNSTISPDIVSFDKKTSAQSDVVTTLSLNGNTLAGISNGGTALVSSTDYTVTGAGDTVTILKSYLAAQLLGITSLTFTFSAGANQTLIFMISDTTPGVEATPTIAIDYVNEELTGFEDGGGYTIGGTPVSPVGGKLDVASYLGAAIAIVKKGDGTTTVDSAAQNLAVPARPATPTATGVNPTTVGGTGELTGVTTAMEYKSASGTWTDITGTEVTGLSAGTYQIRVKATASSFKSAEQIVTLTAPGEYTVTIGNGGIGSNGSGSYTSGVTVTVYAGSRSGYSFTGWTSTDGVTFTNASSATTSFIMPGRNVTVTAIFEPIPVTAYNLTVSGSYAEIPGAGSYTEGVTVSVYAGSRSGYIFTGWTTTDGVTFANAGNATTSFIMPGRNVTVTANWSYNGGSSSGGGSRANSSSSEAVPSITIDKSPGQPTVVSVNLTATADQIGVASVIIREAQIKTWIDAAKKEAQNKGNMADGIAIVCYIQFGANGNSFSVKLEQGTVALLEKEGVKRFAVNTSLVSFSFDPVVIQEMKSQASGDVTIAASPVTKLSKAAGALIGVRPVYELTVSYQKDGQTAYVTKFGKGSVTLGISYKAASGERTGDIYPVYVNKDGKPQLLIRSRYDNGKLVFNRSSLSIYGVGVLEPAPAFNDTAEHWAKEKIDFVVSRGLIAGTSAANFSPGTAITRADFLMALGKLSGGDISDYKQSSFTDVSSTNPAMPYIEWAVQNKIVQGVGNNRFSPDSPITREQMAVMMAGFAQTTGYKLPVYRQAVTFADGAEISSWAQDAVRAIQQTGVVEGKDNNRFDPAENATRAEASTILQRFVEYVIDEGR
ncbi:X2-like carbohydrate binding domain-containing protein [Paenibacillus thalictri]|uniref:SLH domain-containing protein n=1 Tax=Paenibacillus thalictri TaxID=2527873 RepID=A0A4Q9DLX1_9BACL|nr:X2-like carbohydrate binding domain-containing protein [Paenibacillus thalictri]TBL76237.1 hypothetical protein EYB31_19725 [Paenibacillus thalictri]